jgi:hypothetical protein
MFIDSVVYNTLLFRIGQPLESNDTLAYGHRPEVQDIRRPEQVDIQPMEAAQAVWVVDRRG